MKPMIYSYSRVSTLEQVSGTGLTMQVDEKLLEELSQKYSLPISQDRFSDKGKSAFHGTHLKHELGAFIRAVEAGDVKSGSILVVISLDRLSRLSLRSANDTYNRLTHNGIHIYSMVEAHLYDADDLTSHILSGVSFERAHNESKTKSVRSKGALLAQIQRHLNGDRSACGYPIKINQKHPAWIDTSKGIVRPKPEWFNALRDYYKLSLEGYGVNKMVDHLREAHPFQDWKYSQVQKLHTKRSLMGEYIVTTGGVTYDLKNYLPPVLTESEFYRLKEVKSKRVLKRSNVKGSFLTGHKTSTCGHCGASMVSGVSNGKRIIKCVGYAKKLTSCGGVSMYASIAEEAIRRNISALYFAAPEAEPPSKDIYQSVETKLEEVRALFDELPSKALAQSLQNLERQLEDKQGEYEKLLTEHSTNSFCLNTSEVLKASSDEMRLHLYRSFKSVRFHKVAYSTYLVSLLSNMGWKHIYLKRGEVKRVGSIYINQDKAQSFVESPDLTILDHWLNTISEIDYLEYNKDEL